MRSFENMVVSSFQRTRSGCKIDKFYTTGRQRKIDCSSVDDFYSPCITLFEAMVCFYHFCLCEEVCPSFTEDGIQRGGKTENLLNWIEAIYEKNAPLLKKCASVNHGDCTIQILIAKNISEKSFSRNVHLCSSAIIGKKTKTECFFGYIQCDIEVPELLRVKFANFPAIFKNTLFSKYGIGNFMKTCAEEREIMSQPGKRLISTYKTVHSLVLCLYSTSNWDSFVQKHTASLSTLQKFVSTALYSQQ